MADRMEPGSGDEGEEMAGVGRWTSVRGKLWGLVRWEPVPETGEHPAEWVEERNLGAH